MQPLTKILSFVCWFGLGGGELFSFCCCYFGLGGWFLFEMESQNPHQTVLELIIDKLALNSQPCAQVLR